jgi:hypothetical protein
MRLDGIVEGCVGILQQVQLAVDVTTPDDVLGHPG